MAHCKYYIDGNYCTYYAIIVLLLLITLIFLKTFTFQYISQNVFNQYSVTILKYQCPKTTKVSFSFTLFVYLRLWEGCSFLCYL